MSKIQDRIKKEWQRFISRVLARFMPDPVQDADQPQETQNTPPTSEANQDIDEPIHDDLVINSFGSPNCSKAKEDPNTQIKDLKMGDGWLSYKWSKGNLRNWGIKNDHDASALAIAGYGSDGKQYRCAKFDWISSDRLTRGFENIDGGYNGFNGKAFRQAQHKCFFIMSKDGSKRTNILTV